MAATSMNILTNNCLGGFIYRDVLHTEYQNPFIWTLIDDSFFIHLVENFNQLNFYNYTVKKRSVDWTINNDFETIIDNTIYIQNIHMHFDSSALTPISTNGAPKQEKHLWTSGVRYAKIWEYISQCYCKRLKRMQNTTKTIIVYWRQNESSTTISKLIDIADNNNHPYIIFDNTGLPIQRTETSLILSAPPNLDRPQPLIQTYGTEIKNFISEIAK